MIRIIDNDQTNHLAIIHLLHNALNTTTTPPSTRHKSSSFHPCHTFPQKTGDRSRTQPHNGVFPCEGTRRAAKRKPEYHLHKLLIIARDEQYISLCD